MHSLVGSRQLPTPTKLSSHDSTRLGPKKDRAGGGRRRRERVEFIHKDTPPTGMAQQAVPRLIRFVLVFDSL
jgi:hypothetical protein